MITLVALVISTLVNPAVTQANIQTTICKPGWTKSIRPPVKFTQLIKRQRMEGLHLSGAASDYELDHRLPLELGGNPVALDNLVMQPWPEARVKDVDEHKFNRLVCSGKMSLVTAQQAILAKWTR